MQVEKKLFNLAGTKLVVLQGMNNDAMDIGSIKARGGKYRIGGKYEDGVMKVRETSKVPIIMLTAKSDESDELTGFELGVDEYISKPFSPKILVARVNALLRRSGLTAGNDEKFVEAGGIKLDKTAHLVTVDGRPIELSIKEFELLDYFMENQGIALSREKILNNVWNYDYFGDARTIDTHVKKLRAKIGEKGEYIKTIWGVGYKFIVE